jgi:hypothetical protein
MVGSWPALMSRPPPMRMACVTRKTRKNGVSARTDSLTPRRFTTVSTNIITISNWNLCGSQSAGRKLKTASTPEATETVIVRM